MAIVAVAVLFITAEYKRGMIRTTFAASPRRGRVVAAKALVIAAATFVLGLVGCAIALLVGLPMLRDNGFKPPAFPDVSPVDRPALVAAGGTAVALALIAVFAFGLGAILRRSAAAITAVVILVVTPQILVSALPRSAALWLMRLSPAAAFSVQEVPPRYQQVSRVCLPEDGCAYGSPWAGIGVIAVYAAVTMGIALWLLRRRDA